MMDEIQVIDYGWYTLTMRLVDGEWRWKMEIKEPNEDRLTQ